MSNISKRGPKVADDVQHKKEAFRIVGGKAEYLPITYDDIEQALKDGSLQTNLPFRIVDLNKERFLSLVKELSPKNDYKECWVPAEPRLYLKGKGFSVNGVRGQRIEKQTKVREALRPALVVANVFEVRIPWHDSLLRVATAGGSIYGKSVLTALGVQGNRERFYCELEEHGDIYLSLFTDYKVYQAAEGLFDQRIVPFLQRWSSPANDELLETICRIANCIDDCSIDGVLASFFYRWYHRVKNEYQHLEELGLLERVV